MRPFKGAGSADAAHISSAPVAQGAEITLSVHSCGATPCVYPRVGGLHRTGHCVSQAASGFGLPHNDKKAHGSTWEVLMSAGIRIYGSIAQRSMVVSHVGHLVVVEFDVIRLRGLRLGAFCRYDGRRHIFDAHAL